MSVSLQLMRVRVLIRGRSLKRFSQVSALAGVLFLATGCLVTQESSQALKGAAFTTEAFNKVNIGDCKRSVREHLGQPSAIDPEGNGMETWTYAYSATNEGSVTVLFVFRGDNSTVDSDAAHIEFCGDKVKQKLHDGNATLPPQWAAGSGGQENGIR